MSLSTERLSKKLRPDFARFENVPLVEHIQTDSDMINRLYNASFRMFLECSLPGIELHHRYLGRGSHKNIATCFLWEETLLTLSPCFPDELTSSAQWEGEVRGHISLWSKVQSCYEQWMSLGAPSLCQYEMVVARSEVQRIHLKSFPLSSREMEQSL